MNPFSRGSWKREARRIYRGQPSAFDYLAWAVVALLILAAILGLLWGG